MGDIVRMYRTYDYKTQVLAASIRNTKHIIECVEVGADVATLSVECYQGFIESSVDGFGIEEVSGRL